MDQNISDLGPWAKTLDHKTYIELATDPLFNPKSQDHNFGPESPGNKSVRRSMVGDKHIHVTFM